MRLFIAEMRRRFSATRKASEMCSEDLDVLLDILNIKLVLKGENKPEDFHDRETRDFSFWYCHACVFMVVYLFYTVCCRNEGDTEVSRKTLL